MALVSCPECKNQVSTNAKHCQKCGCPFSDNELDKLLEKKTEQEGEFFSGCIGFILLALFLGYCQLRDSPPLELTHQERVEISTNIIPDLEKEKKETQEDCGLPQN